MEEVPGADLSDAEIDIRLRRTCVYTDLPMENCHKCRSKLVRRYQSYMVLTRLGGRAADAFVLGGDFGLFCLRCPTVVVEMAQVAAMLAHARADWDLPLGLDIPCHG